MRKDPAILFNRTGNPPLPGGFAGFNLGCLLLVGYLWSTLARVSHNQSAGKADSPEPQDHLEEAVFPSALNWLQRYPEQTPPRPKRMRMTPIGVVGTMIWAIVAVVLTTFEADLAAAGREWWLLCAQMGAGIGAIGTVVMIIHDRRGVRKNGALRSHPDDQE